MVIRVLEIVPDCYSWAHGETVGETLRRAFVNEAEVVISFEGVDDVPSAFVNAAFLPLLDSYGFEDVRRRLKIINSTRQINDMIRRRIVFEAAARNQAVNESDLKRRA
jgi:hypothetical protein